MSATLTISSDYAALATDKFDIYYGYEYAMVCGRTISNDWEQNAYGAVVKDHAGKVLFHANDSELPNVREDTMEAKLLSAIGFMLDKGVFA